MLLEVRHCLGRYFNPHSPCGERHYAPFFPGSMRFISIHTPHAGSDRIEWRQKHPIIISIHTPHAGSDRADIHSWLLMAYFNPHSPCGERPVKSLIIMLTMRFQSTLPMRGATPFSVAAAFMIRDFNPHSPCGERPALTYLVCPVISISIHTPHAGSDASHAAPIINPRIFQSTLPMRGATTMCRYPLSLSLISIHTPHAGSDKGPSAAACVPQSFQSTLPMRGATLSAHVAQINIFSIFQSTLPMRGATAKVTEFTLNLKTKFMTFGTKTNCETLQSSVSRICSNEKNYISQVRISKQFMIASHSHIYKISGSSGIYDALFPKCSTFF